ncbi:hypothetical protein LCGC14_3059160 [marine sediment metagenome]|uniref:Cobalamin-independent methionine synthase MetE C-terminal/archaeal domain-containing protein n=1 Tax=marine sediment metagenome TaxID=412755 RepID=A0A0F8YS89_9ZZZZ
MPRKRKTAKPKQAAASTFEDRLNAYLNGVARLVMQSRARPGGAIKFGRDAMHVLLIEAARSKMELLEDWKRTGYENEIGPGIYDIHSPRVPSTEEMAELLREAAQVLRPDQLWVDPDCGLKTRRWEEAEPSLRNMVEAARQLREELVPAAP